MKHRIAILPVRNTRNQEGVQKMKKLNTILSITILIVFIAGSVVVAQGPEEADRGAGPRFRGMHGGGGMMGGGPGRMMGRGGRMGGRMGRGPRGGRSKMVGGIGAILHLADELDLSEGQREELSEIFSSHKKEVIRLKAEIATVKVDLQKLIRQEEPDLGELEVQFTEIAGRQVEIKLAQIRVKIDARNVLTEEQKTALKKIRQDRQAKRRAGAERPPERSEGRRMGRGPRRGPRDGE